MSFGVAHFAVQDIVRMGLKLGDLLIVLLELQFIVEIDHLMNILSVVFYFPYRSILLKVRVFIDRLVLLPY